MINDGLRKTIRNYYSDALACEYKFYRGDTSDKKYLIKEAPLYHLSEGNVLFNLLLNVVDDWKNKPQRTKSYVCTTRIKTAKRYGNVFRVLPKNGSTMIITPKSTFWNSFDNYLISPIDFLGTLKYYWPHGYPGDKNITITDLKSVIRYIDENVDDYKNVFTFKRGINVKWVSFSSVLNVVLSFKNNDFIQKPLEQISNITLSNRRNFEIWTNSTLLFINEDFLSELLD